MPFFIDKMPNNFFHVGLIHLILPNAKIIDARRHPLACCFSGFKQYFARGQNFSYGLEDLGHYYRDYVELMEHFDAVLPGRVHRVIYERMVDDTESEVRRLLDYCRLPFEDRCLRFFENNRPVRTASSEQVRRPIYGWPLATFRAVVGSAQDGLGRRARTLSRSARFSGRAATTKQPLTRWEMDHEGQHTYTAHGIVTRPARRGDQPAIGSTVAIAQDERARCGR